MTFVFKGLSTIATKHKHFGNKVYNHSDMTGYTCSTVRYSTQTATVELMMHTINCSNRINSIVKVLMCVLFLIIYENLSFVVLHNLQPLQFPCLMTYSTHDCPYVHPEFFTAGAELNLRPYINCVGFENYSLTHLLHGAESFLRS